MGPLPGFFLTVAVVLLLAGCSAGVGRTGGKGGGGFAAEYSEEAVDLRTEAHARFANAVLYELNGEAEAAAREYFQAALADAANEGLVMDASGRLLQQRFNEEALELMKKAASYATASGDIHARLGLVHVIRGDTNLAIKANLAAVRSRPPSVQGYRQLAHIHLQTRNFKEGVKVLDEAEAIPGLSLMQRLEMVELYLSMWREAEGGERAGIREKALAVLDELEAEKTANPILLQKLAEHYGMLGESKREAAVYAELMERLPDLPAIRDKLLSIYLSSSEHEQAVELLEKEVRDNPTNPRAYYILGGIALEMGDPKTAIDRYGKAILLDERFEQAYYNLALAQINVDQPKAALEILEKARARFKETFSGEFYSGLAYGRMKDWSNAVTHLVAAEVIARATETNRLTHGFFFQLGSVYERNQRYEEAENYFMKALELSPDSDETLNYLGYMWAERGVKLEEARKLIQRAVELSPDNPAYLDSLAWVLFKMGRVEEGLPHMLRALEKSEEPDPTLYDHLGDFYSRLNQMEKAREAWGKALQMEPNEGIEGKLRGAGP